MTSSWPTGSRRRGRAARDSGTNSAVSTIAATPTGMLTQKIPRQPTLSTSTPPRGGPAAMDRPNTPPQMPMARARSRGSVKVLAMIDTATGFIIEPPTAWSMRNATSQPRPGARLQQRTEGEDGEPDLEDFAPPEPVRGRSREDEDAGDDDGVGVHR